jgi:NAD(P)-dependent dehydrogenase (short-subunit alcohol dehydrogenase family)
MSVVFITGGNTGLGFETARRLKELGHKVYISCRDRAKGEKAASELGVHYIVIDVTNDESVQNAVQSYMQEESHVDILINNAGIPGGRTAAQDLTADIIYHVYNTNVFGIVRVTHGFLPLLQKSENPVIVNAAPAPAALETPRISGETIGFLNSPWNDAPEAERAAPTITDNNIRGMRMTNSTTRASLLALLRSLPLIISFMILASWEMVIL